MQASEIMTEKVASVAPDTPLPKVAAVLLERGISAVPVVDASGTPIGMVSEGDLIGRNDDEREARRDWWLTLVADGAELNPDYLANLRKPERTARDIMSAPVVTVGETTAAREIARLLAAYHIKRVPVVRDGKIVGIVSRADLLRAFASEHIATTARSHHSEIYEVIGGALSRLDDHFLHARPAPGADTGKVEGAPGDAGLSVENFQGLVGDFEQHKAERQDAARRVAAEQRRETVKKMVDQHIADASWKSTLHRARQAAEHGEKQFMLLRFPSDLCSDGGRAINAPLPDWPKTLRGEAAETYLRWQRDLRPHGFHLTAHVLDFPGGKPGDIGLFLAWGA